MSMLSSTASAVERSYDALRDAYDAANAVFPLLQSGVYATSPTAQRDAITEWADRYLTRKGAPAELVQDCVQWLQTTTNATGHACIHDDSSSADGDGSNQLPSAPSQATTRTSRSAGQALFHSASAAARTRDGVPRAGSASSDTSGGAAASSQAPVSLNANLDVDHCTISRMLADEARQWEALHKTQPDPFESTFGKAAYRSGAPLLGAPSLSCDAECIDVFSPAAVQQEAWLCWAAVLRDIKIEAAVQQLQGRRDLDDVNAVYGTHSTLDGLLDYLEAPETPWLLEDPNSAVLMAADMYMANRAYAKPNATDNDGDIHSCDGLDAPDTMNGFDGRGGRDTHDMKAVHGYVLRQDSAAPPLRSLLELTLAHHIGDRGSA